MSSTAETAGNADFILPFFFKDFLSQTSAWKAEERWTFLALLIHQWTDKTHTIPEDLDRLALIEPQIYKFKELILPGYGGSDPKFKKSSPGRLQNTWLEGIRIEQLEHHIKKVRGGLVTSFMKEGNSREIALELAEAEIVRRYRDDGAQERSESGKDVKSITGKKPEKKAQPPAEPLANDTAEGSAHPPAEPLAKRQPSPSSSSLSSNTISPEGEERLSPEEMKKNNFKKPTAGEPPPIARHPLQTFIDGLPNVLSMKKQLTEEDCKRLYESLPVEVIEDILIGMENKKSLAKDYVSVNLTVRSWASMRKRKSGGTNTPIQSGGNGGRKSFQANETIYD